MTNNLFPPPRGANLRERPGPISPAVNTMLTLRYLLFRYTRKWAILPILLLFGGSSGYFLFFVEWTQLSVIVALGFGASFTIFTVVEWDDSLKDWRAVRAKVTNPEQLKNGLTVNELMVLLLQQPRLRYYELPLEFLLRRGLLQRGWGKSAKQNFQEVLDTVERYQGQITSAGKQAESSYELEWERLSTARDEMANKMEAARQDAEAKARDKLIADLRAQAEGTEPPALDAEATAQPATS